MANSLNTTDAFYWVDDDEVAQVITAEQQQQAQVRAAYGIEPTYEDGRPIDYSDILFKLQLPASNLSLFDHLGPPARRVAYMRGLRELRRPHRRAILFVKRKTYPIRHPWQALKEYVLYHYGDSDY